MIENRGLSAVEKAQAKLYAAKIRFWSIWGVTITAFLLTGIVGYVIAFQERNVTIDNPLHFFLAHSAGDFISLAGITLLFEFIKKRLTEGMHEEVQNSLEQFSENRILEREEELNKRRIELQRFQTEVKKLSDEHNKLSQKYIQSQKKMAHKSREWAQLVKRMQRIKIASQKEQRRQKELFGNSGLQGLDLPVELKAMVYDEAMAKITILEEEKESMIKEINTQPIRFIMRRRGWLWSKDS